MSRPARLGIVVLCLVHSACTQSRGDDLDRFQISFALFGEEKKATDDHSDEVVPSRPEFSLADNGKRIKPRNVNSIYVVERAERDRLLIKEKGHDSVRGWVGSSDVVPLSRADSLFSAAIKDNPNNAFAYVMRAMVRARLDQLERAGADVQEALRLDPSRRDALLQRALIEFSQDQLDPALADIDRVIQLDPSDPETYVTRALMNEKKGDHKKSIADITAALKLGCQSPALRWTSVMIMLELRQTKMARKLVTSWLQSQPDRDETYKCLIISALIDLRDWKPVTAISDLGKAIAIDSKKDTAYLVKAAIYAFLGLSRKSWDEINMAIRVNPDNGGSYRVRAGARIHRREYALALADFETAIGKGPRDADAHAGRAVLLATCPDAKIRCGRDAVASATRACELSRWKTARYVAGLAAAHAEAGDFRAAVQYQEKAIGLLNKYDPNEAAYHKTLDRYKTNKPYYRLSVLEEWDFGRLSRR